MGISKNRVFDTEQLQTLINKTQTLMETADTVTEELYSELCRLSDTLGKLPSDLQDSGFKERVDTLKQSIKTEDFKNYYTSMTKSLKRLKETIPKEDQKLGKKVDIMAASVETVTKRLKKLKDLIPEGVDTGSYADFEKAYTRCTSSWGSTAKALNNLLDKINASLKGGKNQAVCFSEDPVNLSTGNFIYEKTDLKLEDMPELALTRFYNELDKREGAFGRGWRHPYEVSLLMEEADYTVILEDGKEEQFQKKKDGSFFGETTCSRLQAEANGYIYCTKDGTRYHFNEAGQYTAWEDRAGNRLLLTYQEERLTKVLRETDGAYFTFRYDEIGHLTAVSDAQDRTASYRYDPEGRLAQAANAAGEAYTYTYDEAGRIRGVENPQGITTVENQYDSKGRTIHQTFPDGGSMSYQYDDEARQVTLTERNQSRITYCHNERYQNVRTIYEDGEEQFAYNRKGQRILYRDCNGNTTRYAYDSRGNLTQVIDALGVKSNATYDENNQLLKFSVNGTQQLKNTYDSQGNLIESKDALGRTTVFTYQEKGRPETITQPDGGTVTLTYDEKGNISGITDPYGNQSTYQYNSISQVIKAVSPKGAVTSYQYDAMNRMTAFLDPLGQVTEYQYNPSGKQVLVRRPDGSTIQTQYNVLNRPSAIVNAAGDQAEFTYDSMWNLSGVRLPDGGREQYAYDSRNRLSSITDPLGNKTTYGYDPNGNRILEITPRGEEIHYAYNARNQLERITDAEGNTTSYLYDERGLLTEETDALGNKKCITYDEAGQKIKETNAEGHAISYTYTPLGEIETLTDAEGRTTHYHYEAGGRLTGITYPDQTKETFTYDANGNLRTHTGREGFQKTYVYDLSDRIQSIEGSDGAKTDYTYDALGNVTSVTDALGNTTRYSYSATGQLTGVADALGNKTRYGYDALGRLTQISQYAEDGTCQTTRYQRNLCGQVETITDALGGQEFYAYDAKGQLIEKTDKEGYVTTYGYTPNGQAARIRYGDGREVNLGYNPLGQLTQVKDWLGVTQIQNDVLGRAQKVQYPDGKEVSYTFGAAGERRSLTYPDGRTVYYEYDENLRLKELKEGDRIIGYAYDTAGRLKEKQYPNGMHSSYQYDARGRIETLQHADEKGVLDAYRYQYDLLGNKTGIEKQRRGYPEESGSYTYGYDPLGRLSQIQKDGQLQTTYGYDAFGNRVLKQEGEQKTTYHYNALNQLTGFQEIQQEVATETGYTYDKRGNLQTKTENGQISRRYHYGALNRLEQVVNRTGETAKYDYNGLGFRVGKQTGFIHPEKQEAYMDPLCHLQEQTLHPEHQIQYTIDLTRSYHNLLEQTQDDAAQTYLWDGNVAGMLEGEEANFYLTDELGSPLRLLDEAGELVESYGYGAFGEDLYGNQGKLQPFGYTGYQADETAGTYFAQAREYLPEMGRFAAKDKNKYIKKEKAGTINLYNYCMQNPLRWIDPRGFDLEDHYSPTSGKNDPIKISVDGNRVIIDVYVDIGGDLDVEIEGVTVHDLVIQGIENWGGNYENVFGHDTLVEVNVHEGHKSWWSWLPWMSGQNYIDILLNTGSGRAFASFSSPRDKSNPGEITMYTLRKNGRERLAYDYRNTITHEFGHLFGIDDGYADDNYKNDDTLRPEATIISIDDVMRRNHRRDADVFDIDIQMLLLAATTGEWQYYMSYLSNNQSIGVETYGRCDCD